MGTNIKAEALTHINPEFCNSTIRFEGAYKRRQNPARLIETEDQIQSNPKLEEGQEQAKINFPFEKWNVINKPPTVIPNKKLASIRLNE